jgi:hypothetical protein
MPPPLAKVVGGSLFAYSPDHADFTLETAEFVAQFQLGDTGSIKLPLKPPIGSSFDCDAILFGGQTLRYGLVDHAGHAHEKLWFEGTLSFTTEIHIQVPSQPPSGPIHLSTPFTFSGDLLAFTSDPFVDPPPKTFEYKLVGKGIVTVRLTQPFGPLRKVTSYFYQFT